ERDVNSEPAGMAPGSTGVDEAEVDPGKRSNPVVGGAATGEMAGGEVAVNTEHVTAADDAIRIWPVRIRVERSLVDDIVEDPAILGARIVPNMPHGVPRGFRIFGIRPHTLARRLGLSNGDHVQSI